MRSVEIAEIDFPRCTLTYGVAPCAAILGTTGTIKCFNTARTCQDRANYTEGTETIRFVKSDMGTSEYGGIPSLERISITPAIIEPGISLGERETAQVVFRDHPDSDILTDPYASERAYDPFEQGTFWAKIRARIPSLRGSTLRIYRGELGHAVSAMDSWSYVIEETGGPQRGRFTVKGKDPIKFLDGDRAQAPTVTPGILLNDLPAGQTNATLSPAGVGDSYYPSSGFVAIGGSEVCAFTRTADDMTLTRAQEGTDDVDHDQFDGVQLVLVYDGESPADIIYDLITEFTDLDPLWIPLVDWQQEMASYINRLYSAKIAEPTPVKDLINELIEQVGLVMWADLQSERLNLNALRPVSSSATVYDESRIEAGSFQSKEQLDKRVSQAWTYIGLRNPLAELDDRANYKSVVVSIDETGSDEEYGNQPAIKKTFSRWITTFNRAAASRLNDLLLSRYRDPPRRLEFDVFRTDTPPQLGRGALMNHFELQSADGSNPNVSVQIVSLEPGEAGYQCVAEELDFTLDEDDPVVIIDQNDICLNLRELYDSIYGAPSNYDTVTFIIESGVYVGTPWQQFAFAEAADLTPLENPDFEEGDTGWTWEGAGDGQIISGYDSYNGTWAALAGYSSTPNGEFLHLTNNARHPISPGQGVGFRMRMKSEDPGGGDASTAAIRIIFYDAGLNPIQEVQGNSFWSHKFEPAALTTFHISKVTAIAPAGAAYCACQWRVAWGDGPYILDAFEIYNDCFYAVDVGEWPEGPTLVLVNNGEIRAGGGRGGNPDGEDGINGATGIRTRYPISIENNGVIAGGGGGGGGGATGFGGGGGGGAGYSQDDFGEQTFAPGGGGLNPGDDGTVETGGAGGTPAQAGGDGGDGGEDGNAGSGGSGGTGGNAIDGDSVVTLTVEGTILGDRIN